MSTPTNAEAYQAIVKARIQLIRNHPFFGVLALRLQPVEDLTLNPPTLATDGRKMYYHPDWVLSQPDGIRQAGVGHEVIHCVLNHLGRRGAREKLRWNYAIDYATNAMLADCKFTIPDTWLYDPKYANMTAEEIYHLLPPMPPDQQSQSFDSHSQGDDGEGMGDMANADRDELEMDWRVATAQAAASAQALAKAGQGTLPESLKRFLDSLAEPKVDWRSALQRFARTRSNDDYAWTRPNRKMLAAGHWLPGLDGQRMNLAVAAVDTSGSINNEILAAFGSEISDIHATMQPENSVVIYCDAAVNHVDEFDRYDTLMLNMHGGGGTDFRPPFHHVEQNDLQPDCFIYLTDGYGPFPSEPPPYPVMWVMTTDVVPPWGEHVRIEL